MILPGTGRGTIRRMVDGRVRVLRTTTIMNSLRCSSTSFAGPPPPLGED